MTILALSVAVALALALTCANRRDETLHADKPNACLACLDGFNAFESLMPRARCVREIGQNKPTTLEIRYRESGKQITSIKLTLLNPSTQAPHTTQHSKFTCIPFGSHCASSMLSTAGCLATHHFSERWTSAKPPPSSHSGRASRPWDRHSQYIFRSTWLQIMMFMSWSCTLNIIKKQVEPATLAVLQWHENKISATSKSYLQCRAICQNDET